MILKNIPLFLLIVFSFSSCTRVIEYNVQPDGQVVIMPGPVEVKDIKEVPWKVGPRMKQRASKGLFVRFELPFFKSEDLLDLVTKRGVDSWLIRLRKKNLASSKIIKKVFLPFAQTGGGDDSGKIYVNQQRSITFSIFYKAASKIRWSNRPCPPFNHESRIEEVEIKRTPDAERILILNEEGRKNFVDAARPYSFKNQIVNAGDILTGEYTLELALYYSRKKERKTDFMVFSDAAVVSKEILIGLTGCENYKSKDIDNSDVMKGFQFGK